MAHSIQSPAVDVFSLFPPKKTNSAVVPLSTSKRIAYENFNSDESAHSSARSRIFLISSDFLNFFNFSDFLNFFGFFGFF